MAEDYPRTLMELERRFSDDSACREYLTGLRWPEGFVCPNCQAHEGLAVRRDLWRCMGCRREVSVMAGTVFQDSKLPLTVWIRAMWQVTAQKNGVSAMGLQRVLGLGSYKTAWTVLHKLRRAMVRPGRERLRGLVEVDETYWGGEEEDVHGRETYEKALIVIASEADGEGIGRIRLRHILDASRATLHGFIAESIEPGATVQTDGLQAYRELKGYVHDRRIQKHQRALSVRIISKITSTNSRFVSTAAPRPLAASCSIDSPSKRCRSRRRPTTRSENTIRSGWWSHVNTPKTPCAVLAAEEHFLSGQTVRWLSPASQFHQRPTQGK
jgi:hypothetical protein